MSKSYCIRKKDHVMFSYYLSTGATCQSMADLFGCARMRVNWIIDKFMRERIAASVHRHRASDRWREQSRKKLITALEQTPIAA